MRPLSTRQSGRDTAAHAARANAGHDHVLEGVEAVWCARWHAPAPRLWQQLTGAVGVLGPGEVLLAASAARWVACSRRSNGDVGA